jgi:hypothetical protein
LHVDSLLVYCLGPIAAYDYFCSAAVVAAGETAAGFFRLPMRSVISGAMSKGTTPSNG